MTSIDVEACFRSHYSRHFGDPATVESFDEKPDHPTIHILGFDGVCEGCRTFFSLGLTNYRDQIERNVEVCAPVDEAYGEVPHILASVLYFLVQQRMQIGLGQSITFEAVFPLFTQEYSKTALYFTHGGILPSQVTTVKCDASIAGQIYLAIFISEKEHRYFTQHGWDAFETLLEERLDDPFDIRRSSVVSDEDFARVG